MTAMSSTVSRVWRRWGDDQSGAAVQQVGGRGRDELLGSGVEAARGFVEHDHRRIGEEGTSEREQLGLAGGQPGQAVELGLEPSGQASPPPVETDTVEGRL